MMHTFVPKVRGQAFHFQLSETHEAQGRKGVGTLNCLECISLCLKLKASRGA